MFVNANQTQMLYAPGNKMTWAETGSSQVSVLGAEEKWAFTVMVSVAASGEALLFQAVYAGKSDKSCPSKTSPYHDTALEVGFQFVFSGTDMYWSNHETMHQYVDQILVPYIKKQKQLHGLPENQKTLWSIDVWAVHRSKEFRTWMKENHLNILLDYIPGGCTGVGQPCDVGIQRPFKLLATRSYHEDVVNSFVTQINAGDEPVMDKRLKNIRDGSVQWLVNAFNVTNNKDPVKKK